MNVLQVSTVATAAGGFAESVENGKTGFLVSVGDHEALAAAAIRLLDDVSLRNSFV